MISSGRLAYVGSMFQGLVVDACATLPSPSGGVCVYGRREVCVSMEAEKCVWVCGVWRFPPVICVCLCARVYVVRARRW